MFKKIQKKFQQHDSRVWWLFFTRIFNALGFSVVLPFLSIYLHQDLHVSMSIIGTIFLVSAAVRAGSQYLGGELADRFGRKKVLFIGALGRVVVFVVLGFVVYFKGHFIFLALGVMFTYLFGGMFFTAADAMVADVVPPWERMEVYAIQRIGINLGWAVGPAMAGFLATLPFYMLFFITATIFIIPVFLVALFIVESHYTPRKQGEPLRIALHFGEMKSFLIFCFFSLLAFSTLTQIVSTLAVFSVDEIGIAKSQVAYLFSLNGFLVVFFQFHTAKLFRMVALTHALSIGALFVMLGYLAVPFASGFGLLALSMILITFGEILITPSGAALVSRWAPDDRKGRYFGIYGLFMAFGRSVGPFYGGVLMDLLRHSAIELWGSIAGVALMAALGYSWVGRKIPGPVQHQEQRI